MIVRHPQRAHTFASGTPAMGLLFLLLALLLGATSALGADVAQASAATPGRVFDWRRFLAPFHAVILHFPIGFLTMALVLEFFRRRRSSEDLRRVTTLAIWLSLITGLMSATLGILRAESGGYEHRELELHRWFGLAVPVFTLATLALQRVAFRRGEPLAWLAGYRALLVGTVGLVVVAGHYGGNLTHGSKYLVENAPDFVREFLVDDPPGPAPAADGAATTTPELDEKQKFYVEKIQPVFEAKCIRCHGPEKQKGEYRLDVPEVAIKGGESGKTAIKPGDPMGSQLVRLILLPRDDDDAMPPEGKEPLSADETMAVIQWINSGASFGSNPAVTAGVQP